MGRRRLRMVRAAPEARTGPQPVQRDWDGSPMNTDVMHDETCKVFAKSALASAARASRKMTLASWNPKEDARHYEDLGENQAGRPIMFEVVQSQDRFPHRHRKHDSMARSVAASTASRFYGQGITTEAGLTFTF